MIKSNPMYYVTLCYSSTQKVSCSYGHGSLETQNCDSIGIEVHDPQTDGRIGKERRLDMFFYIRGKLFI